MFLTVTNHSLSFLVMSTCKKVSRHIHLPPERVSAFSLYDIE
jgi:hypothetical protein